MSERDVLSDFEIKRYEDNTAFCRKLGSENMDGISALNLVGDCETLLASHRALAAQLQAVTEERDGERERREAAERLLVCPFIGNCLENRKTYSNAPVCERCAHFAKYGGETPKKAAPLSIPPPKYLGPES